MRLENYFKNEFKKIPLNKVVTKILVFALVTFLALLVYRAIDSIEQIPATTTRFPQANSELGRTILHISRLKSTRNMTEDKVEIAEELASLSNLVQEKINRLQTTVSCDVPHIVCGHRSNCGFGCHVHHRMFCLMLSFSMNRSLIFINFSYKQKWSDIFEEFGISCNGTRDSLIVDSGADPVVIKVRRNGATIKSPIQQGLPFPQDLLDRLKRVHTKPYVWLVGQFAKFTLRMLPKVEQMIDVSMEQINFEGPIVGIHVRRTDKLKEQPVSFHPADKYLAEAKNYFETFHPGIPVKRVYLATEDSDVFEEIQQSYRSPEWKILGFPPAPTTENFLTERMEFVYEIVRDLVLLSRCDLVVCGFTSNICRLVYELKQFENSDESASVVSLDKAYYYNVLANKLKTRLVGLELNN